MTAVTADPADATALAQLAQQAGKQVVVGDGRIDVQAEADWSVQLSRLAIDADIVLHRTASG